MMTIVSPQASLHKTWEESKKEGNRIPEGGVGQSARGLCGPGHACGLSLFPFPCPCPLHRIILPSIRRPPTQLFWISEQVERLCRYQIDLSMISTRKWEADLGLCCWHWLHVTSALQLAEAAHGCLLSLPLLLLQLPVVVALLQALPAGAESAMTQLLGLPHQHQLSLQSVYQQHHHHLHRCRSPAHTIQMRSSQRHWE